MNQQPPTDSATRAGERRIWWLVLALFALWPLAIVVSRTSGGDDAVPWLESLEQASSESRQSGRPMLVYFTAQWCPACQHMQRYVFAKPRVAEAIEARCVPVKVDLTDQRPDDEALAIRYGADYLPTFIILHPDGRELARYAGYMSEQTLLAWLESPGAAR